MLAYMYDEMYDVVRNVNVIRQIRGISFDLGSQYFQELFVCRVRTTRSALENTTMILKFEYRDYHCP